MVLTITKENFEQEVLKAEGTVLVDFWAAWCTPCKMFLPELENFAEERSDIKVGKINVDEQPELMREYGITVIPTIIKFENGKELNRKSGNMSKSDIDEVIG